MYHIALNIDFFKVSHSYNFEYQLEFIWINFKHMVLDSLMVFHARMKVFVASIAEKEPTLAI